MLAVASIQALISGRCFRLLAWAGTGCGAGVGTALFFGYIAGQNTAAGI